MHAPRLHWMRGRQEQGPGVHRTLEWIGHNDAGEAIARVVRILGPVWSGWRTYRAVALDDEAKVIELRPSAPDGGDWLACVGGQVVGRASVPLRAETAAARGWGRVERVGARSRSEWEGKVGWLVRFWNPPTSPNLSAPRGGEGRTQRLS